MNIDQVVAALHESYRQGDYCPSSWIGKLDLDAAYRAQLGLLGCMLADGDKQAGWKVGLTADSMRELFGSHEPAFGYLLERGSMPSGTTLHFADLRNPMVENEILVTLASDLAGPRVTSEDAREAIREIAPAFEIVEMRGADMRVDMPLAIADNLSQFAFVHGRPMALPVDFDFSDVQAEVLVNGQLRETVCGGDAMDNQLQTIAWLANTLSRFGRRLRAGERIMTGSFTKPIGVTAGDSIETRFDGVGAVCVRFD